MEENILAKDSKGHKISSVQQVMNDDGTFRKIPPELEEKFYGVEEDYDVKADYESLSDSEKQTLKQMGSPFYGFKKWFRKQDILFLNISSNDPIEFTMNKKESHRL